MDLALWIIAGLLAVAFLAGGTIKLSLSKEKLAAAPGGDGSRTSAPAPSRRSGFSRSWPR
ncbi:hypothetical protein [Nonomuraea recticatena]|uniref:hypothetical protein n=1 Tax=Nonomuraea recticatena TaxID=46178 RepID=UPI003623AAC5